MAADTLFVCRSAPGHDNAAVELLEMAMTTAIFAVPARVLFLGDGVTRLSVIDGDTGLAALRELPLTLLADARALEEHGMAAPAGVRSLPPAELRNLLSDAGKVVMY